MPTPERKRPTKANSPIQLEPEIEDYGVLSAIHPAKPLEPLEPAAPQGSMEPLEPKEPDGEKRSLEPSAPQEPPDDKRSRHPREPAGAREPAAPREPQEPSPNWTPALLGREPYLEKQKRSVSLPVEQIRRAQIAQKASDYLGGEYQTFSDLVTGAIERELHRLSVLYNHGQSWNEYQGNYRTGRVQDAQK